MYNGYTGEPMEASIFIGSTFYQRLDHMVEDKIKYRSRGHVHPLTRQPVSDRKRNGGVKFGEMERDCLIAHGAAATLQERTFILSDFHSVHVCTKCKQMANWNADRVPVCPSCTKEKNKGVSAIVKLELPYACKLLMQELMSMGISVRLETSSL
jgi:DNA-directed RNA polymerase-4/5 subunit 2